MHHRKFAHFSELTEHNSRIFALFSPKGHAVASAIQSQLQIWNINSKEISHRFEGDSLIDFLKWSPDSELICCGMLKECIQVWNLDMSHWRCTISGCLPFVNIHWAPDSRHLLVISEFYIKITIFSLVSSIVAEIDNPKAIENGIVFSPCERYLVVAQRVNFEDYLSVYSCDTWETIKTFLVETKDLASISFSPSDLLIAVLESAIECKIIFYSIDGRLLGKYVSEANFGLTSLSWNNIKNFVAVGDCFGEVKVLDYFDFEILSSYNHPDTIDSESTILYKISESSEINNSPVDAFSELFELEEVVKSRPVSLLPSAGDSEKGKTKNPIKSGVQILQLSSDGKYIASVVGSMPETVFIYDVEAFKVCHVIVRGSTVKSVANACFDCRTALRNQSDPNHTQSISWHPEKPYLVICSNSSIFDVWTPKGCIRYISSFTNDFPISHAAWSSTGDCILLNSRDHFSIVFLL